MLAVSIITINLNNQNGLQKTLNSVIHQAFTDYELIVIDGGSTDGSVELLGSMSNKIKYWCSEQDKGIYHAMNKGLYKAMGQYCLFLNSGDWLTDNALIESFSFLINDISIVYGNVICHYSDKIIKPHSYPSLLSMRYFFNTTINHQCTFIKRDLLIKYGGYNESFKIHGDYDFWLKSIIVDNCTSRHLPIFVSNYDMNGLSSRSKILYEQERNMVLKQYFPNYILSDYIYWNKQEKEIEILLWYKQKTVLYTILVLFYKILKKARWNLIRQFF